MAEKFDALRFVARGFGDIDAGNRISGALAEIGFAVKVIVPGEFDNLGGLLETHIMPVNELETDDVEVIRHRVYETTLDEPGIFVQWDGFNRTGGSEV